MARAEVGDDVYGEDPTVRALEERVAELFGHEAALFTPTGSMANVLAVGSLVGAGQEVLCEASAHIARAELGAHGAFGGADDAHLDAPARAGRPGRDRGAVRARHRAVLRADRGGLGREHPQLRRRRGAAARRAARPARVRRPAPAPRVHLDGARLWNAHVATGTPLAEYGAVADVAVGLPVQGARRAGRLAAGRRRADAIAEARVWRKRLGGGMRQVGVLAAAGLYALDHHVERLADDHANARLLAEACGVDPATVDTNIVVVHRPDAAAFVAAAAEAGVLVARSGRRGPAGHPPRRHPGRRRAGRRGAGPALTGGQAGGPTSETSLIAVKSRRGRPSPGSLTRDQPDMTFGARPGRPRSTARRGPRRGPDARGARRRSPRRPARRGGCRGTSRTCGPARPRGLA